MPEAEKTLKETIGASMKETKTPSAVATLEPQQGISDGAQGETQAGETPEREFVSGIDISDIPAQDRPRIKELLSKKAGLLEKGYQPKFQEVAKLKKMQEDLTNAGLTVEEAQSVLVKHLESKNSPKPQTAAEKKATKKLDELLDLSPAEQRDALKQLRQITQEEAADSPVVVELKAQLDSMKKALDSIQGKEFISAKKNAEANLESLKTKLGNDLIETHKDAIMSEWSKYPNSQIKDIVKYVVPDEEYEQALLSNHKPGKKVTQEKINAISSSGSGITGTKEVFDTKQPMKSIIRDLLKSK